MSNWGYVAVAYTLVWGSLAGYAVLLARRVSQARASARGLRNALDGETRAAHEDGAACDIPPAQ